MLRIPKPHLTRDQWSKFLRDPEVVTLEILFIGLTLGNIFILYRLLLNVCPFPITVTWFQLLMGFLFAFILGESSQEWGRFSIFPAFRLNFNLFQTIFFPTLLYLGMLTLANVLLRKLPTVAFFPVAVSLAVVLHHVARFVGCGQQYLPVRWTALGLMVGGFLLGIADARAIGYALFPIALAYAVCSATFRAWCLEKVMHAVEGRGNMLHNHQTVIGLAVLPIVAFLCGESNFWSWMPHDFRHLFTWQVWGCLATVGTVPFLKNIVANRLIRRTGQAPWRALEAVSMLLVFLLGAVTYGGGSVVPSTAFFLVVAGRVLTMLDALSKDPDERRKAIRREEPVHQATLGRSLSPNINDHKGGDYYAAEDNSDLPKQGTSMGRNNNNLPRDGVGYNRGVSSHETNSPPTNSPPRVVESPEHADSVELASRSSGYGSRGLVNEPQHSAARPLLVTIRENE